MGVYGISWAIKQHLGARAKKPRPRLALTKYLLVSLAYLVDDATGHGTVSEAAVRKEVGPLQPKAPDASRKWIDKHLERLRSLGVIEASWSDDQLTIRLIGYQPPEESDEE